MMTGLLVTSIATLFALATGEVVQAKSETMGRFRGVIDTSRSPHVELSSIPMQDIQLTEGFWAERFLATFL